MRRAERYELRRRGAAIRPSRRAHHRGLLALAAGGILLLAGCGSRSVVSDDLTAATEPAAATATTLPGEFLDQRRIALADVAAACASSTDGPGVARVSGDVRDANTSVTIPDCVIHLEQGADVHLNNVQIAGGILNIHDRDTDPSRNRVKLQKVSTDVDALLVELNDADDAIETEASDVVTEQGIGLRAANTRDGANDGGQVRLIGTTLLATDLDATIHVLASEHSGEVRLVETTVDTRGPLTVLAASCSAVLDGETLDCSTATVEGQLGS